MITLFTSLKGFLKKREFCTDSFIFRLHSRWTVLALLCCSILLSCRQFFGDPIHCLNRDVSRIKVVENFCWIHATFILPQAWNGTVGVDVPHPGISNHVPGQNKVYHGYYQWVAIFLFLQGFMFYLPRYLWRCWENGVIKCLCQGLHDPMLSATVRDKSIELLSHSLHIHWGLFESYFKKYILCEMLALVNVVVQMIMLDTFLGGAFTTFGLEVLQWNQWDQEYRTDPLVKAFPRMTKCQFHDYGSSGDVQRVDALCILPLNVLNEKIYIFLWFWFVFLLSVTTLVLIYRLLLAAMPMFRYCVLVTRAPYANKGALDRLVGRSRLSDWFILYLLSKNIDGHNFERVISKLAAAMEQNGYVATPSTSRGSTYV